ncbi:MAG: hypothetical protein VKJ24_06875 [Synechococcales bacterium]|nr:hypothetical protein [Synechococcales bacterium]
MTASPSHRLEQYSEKHPGEVLLVNIQWQGQPDQIAIFKGFSSSLMCPTAFDADVPVLPDEAEIQSIDRLHSPYDPKAPRYIQQGLSWTAFQALLADLGL